MFDLVVASLSIHYFPWSTTQAIVYDISQVLKPGGRLLCRVNRIGDVNFEYGAGPEREPELFEVRPGYFKRFFREETFSDLLAPDFHVDSIQQATTVQVGMEKLTLEATARRRD